MRSQGVRVQCTDESTHIKRLQERSRLVTGIGEKYSPGLMDGKIYFK